jgi:hypothetical protein
MKERERHELLRENIEIETETEAETARETEKGEVTGDVNEENLKKKNKKRKRHKKRRQRCLPYCLVAGAAEQRRAPSSAFARDTIPSSAPRRVPPFPARIANSR